MEVNVAEETEVLFIAGHSSGRNLIYFILDDGPRTTDFFFQLLIFKDSVSLVLVPLAIR